MMNKIVFSLAFASLLTGCLGTIPSPVVPELVYPAPTQLRVTTGEAVRDISLAVSATIPAEHTERLESHGTRQRVHNELMRQLAAGGRLSEAGEITLDVTIDSFRLRTAKQAYNWGAMSGADMLAVTVTVQRGDETLKEFDTGTSTVLAKPKYEVERLDRLVETVSARIIEQL